MFHSRRCSYICTDDPSTKTNVTVSWSIEVFAHSNSASSVVIFFPPGAPSPVSSPSQSPLSFPSPSLSTRQYQLSIVGNYRHLLWELNRGRRTFKSNGPYSAYQGLMAIELERKRRLGFAFSLKSNNRDRTKKI